MIRMCIMPYAKLFCMSHYEDVDCSHESISMLTVMGTHPGGMMGPPKAGSGHSPSMLPREINTTF